MSKSVKVLAAVSVCAAIGMLPGVGPTASATPMASCAGGDFRWTAVKGAITMNPQWLTFTSVGRLWGCTGAQDITGGTFTGVHTAMSDCMHPADGPITVNITWSNGETSTLEGPWPVPLAGPASGPLEVTGGLGRGYRANVIAEYEMMTPDMVMGCMGPGVSTGPGRLSASIA